MKEEAKIKYFTISIFLLGIVTLVAGAFQEYMQIQGLLPGQPPTILIIGGISMIISSIIMAGIYLDSKE